MNSCRLQPWRARIQGQDGDRVKGRAAQWEARVGGKEGGRGDGAGLDESQQSGKKIKRLFKPPKQTAAGLIHASWAMQAMNVGGGRSPAWDSAWRAKPAGRREVICVFRRWLLICPLSQHQLAGHVNHGSVICACIVTGPAALPAHVSTWACPACTTPAETLAAHNICNKNFSARRQEIQIQSSKRTVAFLSERQIRTVTTICPRDACNRRFIPAATSREVRSGHRSAVSTTVQICDIVNALL